MYSAWFQSKQRVDGRTGRGWGGVGWGGQEGFCDMDKILHHTHANFQETSRRQVTVQESSILPKKKLKKGDNSHINWCFHPKSKPAFILSKMNPIHANFHAFCTK